MAGPAGRRPLSGALTLNNPLTWTFPFWQALPGAGGEYEVTLMPETAFPWSVLSEPKLAVHATGAFPAWLWSTGGRRLIWANPAGAAIFGAETCAAIAGREFDADHAAASQIAAIAASMPVSGAPRLQRLRGFGDRIGRLITCICTRVIYENAPAVLVVATEAAGPRLPLAARARRLFEGCGEPVAVYAVRDGLPGELLFATPDAETPPAPATVAVSPAVTVGDGENQMRVMRLPRAAAHRERRKETPTDFVDLTPIAEAISEAQKAMAAERAAFELTAEAQHATEAALAAASERVEAVHAEAAQFVAADETEQETRDDDAAEDVRVADDAGAAGDADAPVEMEAADAAAETEAPADAVNEAEGEGEANAEPEPEPEPEVESKADAAPDLAPDHPTLLERRHPLRFVWTIDADNRFSIEPGDFIDVIGPKIAGELNRPWISIAADLDMDADGEVAHAIASRDTWSGVTIDWPVDGSDERIAVELAGLPVYDRDRNYRGYRGFGVCRDLARITALLAARQQPADVPAEPAAAQIADRIDAAPINSEAADAGIRPVEDELVERIDIDKFAIAPTESEQPEFEQTEVEQTGDEQTGETGAPAAATDMRPALTLIPAAENVVPFRPLSNDNNKTLNPTEQNAFQELATRLTAQLKAADDTTDSEPSSGDAPVADAPAADAPDLTPPPAVDMDTPAAATASTETSVRQDRPLLDLLPVGVLIYRDADFFYANRAFLRWSGHASVQDFAEAGGLTTLSMAPKSDDKDQALRVTAAGEETATRTGHLFSIPWANATAMMLVTVEDAPGEEAVAPAAATAAGADAFRTILDVASDGIVTFDRDGRILTANAGAERMFGYDPGQLTGLPFTNLFASDSAAQADEMLQSVPNAGPARSRDLTARTRRGETLPLQMSIGAIGGEAGTFCAAFQNLSRWKANERELIAARKEAEAASSAKSDFLAKVSHEIRTPLNSIIGFADVMMNERFGPIGTERYKDYLKDIHTSGLHVVSLVNDLLDLSKIEAGKLDLSFEPVNLNDLTQQTVALLQPEASRERIIIRTSLAPELPRVVADARSVRQIVLNLLSNSIKFTHAGGQVILSTARSDHGEAVLRVRDTGVGMSEKDIATALEPFRQLGTASRPDSHGSGLGLPLTKALVEANSARFSIRSAVNSGTLVEIVFPPVRAAE